MGTTDPHDFFDPEEYQRWEEREAAKFTPRHVPAEQRETYSTTTTLRSFYCDCNPTLDAKGRLVPSRWEPIGRVKTKERKQGTLQKERNALTRFETYSRPPEWPASQSWRGPTLAFLSKVNEGYLDGVYQRMLKENGGALCEATIASTRSHLTVILNHALAVGALKRIPPSSPVDREEERAKIYTPDQVDRTFAALRGSHALRTAYWVDLHAGPRAVDLFLLKRTDIVRDHLGRKLLDFTSRKTGKPQAIPISKETDSVLMDWLATHDSEWVFPGLSRPDSDEPEQTYQARVRNAMMRQFLISAGITQEEIPKPWQSARATCNERYESHMPGVGQFILGHKLQGVNAKSYRSPNELVHKAVSTLPAYQPSDRQKRLF